MQKIFEEDQKLQYPVKIPDVAEKFKEFSVAFVKQYDKEELED